MHHRHKHEKHQTKDFYKVTQNYNPKKCKKTSQEKRQYTSNETLWPVRVTIVASKAAMLFLSIVLDPHVSVNNTKSLSVAMEKQEGVPLHCCRATKCFLLLSTIQVFTHFVLHVKCPILLDFKQIWSSTADFRKNPQYQISRKFVQH